MMKGRQPRSRAGFTLVELMVVVMVMMVLTGIVLGIANLASRRAAEGRARADLQQLRNALDEYRLEVGRYPQVTIVYPPIGSGEVDSQDTTDLLNRWRDNITPPLTNFVTDLSFQDPWGRAYQYRPQGRLAYDLWSRGTDPRDSVSEDDIR